MEEIKNFFGDPEYFWLFLFVAVLIVCLIALVIRDKKVAELKKNKIKEKYADYVGRVYLMCKNTWKLYCLDRKFAKDDFIKDGNFMHDIVNFHGDYLPVKIVGFDLSWRSPYCMFEPVDLEGDDNKWKLVFKGMETLVFQNPAGCEISFPMSEYYKNAKVGDNFGFCSYGNYSAGALFVEFLSLDEVY